MRKKVFLIVMCFLCLGFIFFNSSQVSTVSNTRSKEVVNEVINIISKTKTGNMILNKVSLSELNIIIRKIAHGFEYFLLGLVLCFTLRNFNLDKSNRIIYTLFIILFVAVIDEFFQLFIQDRTSSVVDVLIDFGGGILSNVLFFTFSYPKGKHYKKTTYIKKFYYGEK